MNSAVKKVLDEALALTPDDLLELLQEIQARLGSESLTESEQAWIQEIDPGAGSPGEG